LLSVVDGVIKATIKMATRLLKALGGCPRHCLLPAAGLIIASFRAAWKNEYAFRQELLLVMPGVITALFLPVATLEKIALIAVLILVLIVELINSAIEAVVDRISLDSNPLSKNAKDFGSAAVMLALLLAVATWAAILLPMFLK
jgi:diacylglycerol kinase (ATP)